MIQLLLKITGVKNIEGIRRAAPGFVLLDIVTSSVILVLSAIIIWSGIYGMHVFSSRMKQNMIVELEYRYEALQLIYPELYYGN
ncbi:hypothetical protein [Spirochaeta dissipatitropha]